MPQEGIRVLLKEWQIPVDATNEAVASVKVGVPIVKLRVKRIEQAKVKVVARIAERRTEVILRYRVGVADCELQSPVPQVAALQRSEQGVVVRKALVASSVEWVEVRVEQLKRVGSAKGACRPSQEASKSRAVIVSEIIKLATCRTRVFH